MISICRYCGEFKDDGSSKNLSNHYKSAFHKFNFERKNFKLAPVSEEEFNATMHDTHRSFSSDKKQTYCLECKKLFSSLDSYNNHKKTKKHIKNALKIQKFKNSNEPEKQASLLETNHNDKDCFKHIHPQSDNSSDYEDIIENNSCLQSNFCGMCHYKCNLLDMNAHYLEKHSFIIPHILKKKNISDIFIDYFVKYQYEYISCTNCLKSFINDKNLFNHVQDKLHFFPSSSFVELFFEHLSTKIDSTSYEKLYATFRNDLNNINDTNLGLRVSNGSKIICHRMLVSRYVCLKSQIIVPKLHIGLKKRLELSKIPVDTIGVSESLGLNDNDSRIKQIILYELSRKMSIYNNSSFEMARKDRAKSAALRQYNKDRVKLGIQMNKVHRPYPKKLMYL